MLCILLCCVACVLLCCVACHCCVLLCGVVLVSRFVGVVLCLCRVLSCVLVSGSMCGVGVAFFVSCWCLVVLHCVVRVLSRYCLRNVQLRRVFLSSLFPNRTAQRFLEW